MRLINILPAAAQLAQLAYSQESSAATSAQGPRNASSVLSAALTTFPHTTAAITTHIITITPSGSTVFSTTTITRPPISTLSRKTHTVTVTSTVTPDRDYTKQKHQNGIALTWGKAFSNDTSGIEATIPTITAASQPIPAGSYDLRSFPTDVPVVTLTQGGPEVALTVTGSAQNGTNGTFSTITSAPTVWITVTVYPDDTSSGLQAYTGNTLTWSTTFPNTTSRIGVIVASATQPAPAGSGYPGFVSTDVPVIANGSETSQSCAAPEFGVTTSTRELESTGFNASITIPPATPTPDGIGSATELARTGDAMGMTTLTSTATVRSATSTITVTDTDLVIPVQGNNTRPMNIPALSTSPYEDYTATESIGSPVTSRTDEPTVSIQTTMPIESIQPVVTGPVTSAVTAYDSIHLPHGHPPLVTSDQNSRNWNASISCTESSTQELSDAEPAPSSFTTTTTTSSVFIGHPPSLSGYSNGTSANASTSFHRSSTETEPGTISAANLAEIPPTPTIPPAPTIPLDSCSPGIWGRPGCLSTPTNFIDAASTTISHQAQNSTTVSATSLVLGHTSTQSFSTSNTPTIKPTEPASSTISSQTETQALSSSTNSTAQTQCTTTFYSQPTNPCTSTIYASTQTAIVACLGCVGAHALPSLAFEDSSICQNSTTITEPRTTRTVCGFPEPSTGTGSSGSFVTSVTSISSTGAGASHAAETH